MAGFTSESLQYVAPSIAADPKGANQSLTSLNVVLVVPGRQKSVRVVVLICEREGHESSLSTRAKLAEEHHQSVELISAGHRKQLDRLELLKESSGLPVEIRNISELRGIGQGEKRISLLLLQCCDDQLECAIRPANRGGRFLPLSRRWIHTLRQLKAGRRLQYLSRSRLNGIDA